MRIDLSHQFVNSNIGANDIKIETGYGPFAMNIHRIYYSESSPYDSLELTKIYGSLRMSLSSYIEVDLGVGSIKVVGNEDSSYLFWTIPVLIYPAPNYGFEYRPSFYGDTSSHELAVFYKYEYSSIKIGYKWLSTSDNSLNGLYTGLSFSY